MSDFGTQRQSDVITNLCLVFVSRPLKQIEYQIEAFQTEKNT